MFSGRIHKDGDSVIDSWGANADLSVGMNDLELSIGIGYLDNLGDSDNLAEQIEATGQTAKVSSYVGGITANAIAEIGSFIIIGEYLTAVEITLTLMKLHGAAAAQSPVHGISKLLIPSGYLTWIRA